MKWKRHYYGYGDERWCLHDKHGVWVGGIMRKRRYERWLAYVILADGTEPSLGRFATRGKARRAVWLARRSLDGMAGAKRAA